MGRHRAPFAIHPTRTTPSAKRASPVSANVRAEYPESDARLVRQYVNEGIDRFRTAKYAANHRLGFMVGYVISGTASGAVGRVNDYLVKKKRSKEQLHAAALLASDSTWLSEHPRLGQNIAVEIHHSLSIVAPII